MIMAQNSTKHTQVITLDVHHTHTHTHIDCTVAGSSIASTAAAAATSACSGQLTAAATTTQVKPATGGEAQQEEEGRREAGQAQVQQRETKLRARKMKPIQKQTPEATSALDEY